jgi:hypothetical protein
VTLFSRIVVPRHAPLLSVAGLVLLREFYKSYRACVRTKVLGLRADQVAEDDRAALLTAARGYLELADRHAQRFAQPCVVAVYGFSGSGKTTLSTGLAERLRMNQFGTDILRRELFPKDDSTPADPREIYQPSNRMRVYDAMFDLADQSLQAGESIVLDGTFPTSALRERVKALAPR